MAAVLAGGIAAAQSPDDAPPTGAFTMTATPVDAVGPDSAAAFASIVPADEQLAWELVVPESYDPANPPGVLVYISPSDSGKLPRQWRALPAEHNLLWIAANDSGNRRAVARRIAYAVFAVGIASDRHVIDSKRIYLSGFSGGGRVSGLVTAAYPQMFRGAIYIGGAEMWEDGLPEENIQMLRGNRFVFMAGADDFNRPMVQNVASRYADAGIDNLHRIIVPRRAHELPPARYLSEALRFLDGEP
jgi:predicted esterase